MDPRPVREAANRVPTDPTAGRSLVTRRAVRDIVRTATIGSYGVTGFAGGGPLGWLREMLRIGQRGIDVGLEDELTVDLNLTVAYALPVAEVARQVDSAVRYALRRALDREVDRLTIHVDGLRVRSFDSAPPIGERAPDEIGQDDLAASGTDVA